MQDGTVRVWDLRSPPRELSCVTPAETAAGWTGAAVITDSGRRGSGVATTPRGRSGSKGDAATSNRLKSWVSSLHVDDEGNWLTAVR